MNRLTLFTLLASLIILTSFASKAAQLPPNADIFHLSPLQRKTLIKNGFVETPSWSHNFVEIYKNAKKRKQPIFVTTDSILHTSHVLFDYTLRAIEIKKLYPEVVEFTNRMLKDSEREYKLIHDKQLKKLAWLNVGFFSVAEEILNPNFNPPYGLEKLVEREVNNINQHKGLKLRALMLYVKHPSISRTPYAYEDYSQYKPRGHYTRNKTFRKYFKVMMFYGRMGFKLKPGKTAEAIADGRKMTLQALLICYALRTDKKALALYRDIYKTTEFFAGKSDDLTPEEYIKAMNQIYGEELNLNTLSNSKKLSEFIREALHMRSPRILSEAAFKENGDFTLTTKGFKLIGQRFIPDSYVFQNVVFDRVGKYLGKDHPFTLGCIPNAGCVRVLPRGLDVMAALGSKIALNIMKNTGDTEYEKYNKQIHKMKVWFLSRPTHTWLSDMYWMWLYSLKPLLTEKIHLNQPFINKKWTLKELQTALGSWTELRHDTILYAKQSYTVVTTVYVPGTPISNKLPHGYVEPYVDAYWRLLLLANELKSLISMDNTQIPSLLKRLTEYEDLLGRLYRISSKEINGQPLNIKDYKFINNIGSTLKRIVTLPPALSKELTSSADINSALVADVHTSPATDQVLEEATGNPANIYVIVKDKRGTRICRGAVFTYYEFKSKISNRMTDEEWQKASHSYKQPGWLRTLMVR